MLHPYYILILTLVFLLVLLISLQSREESHKLRKAARCLYIPELYIPKVKDLLLYLYEIQPELIRDTDDVFRIKVIEDQSRTFKLINDYLYQELETDSIYNNSY